MTTQLAGISPSASAAMLIADHGHWLDFLLASRRRIRQYDHRLSQIGKQHPELAELSHYLRGCIHTRNQFFGTLAFQLKGRVADLRTDPPNQLLIRQLTHAHPTLQAFITPLADAFAELDETYRTLLPLKAAKTEPIPPAFHSFHPPA